MKPAVLLLCLLVPWLALLAWRDCRDRCLPNVLTLGGATAALVCRYAFGGGAVGNAGLLGGVFCGLFLLLPFILRAAGGGDVKMLFAVGCATGVTRTMDVILFTSLAGLGLMAFMLFWGAADGRRLKHFLRSLFDWRYDRAAGRAALPPKDHERSRVPFGVAIAAGTVFALAWEASVG
ncbi:MAG: prepilin peptidase [Kiritimatiellia bacterium]